VARVQPARKLGGSRSKPNLAGATEAVGVSTIDFHAKEIVGYTFGARRTEHRRKGRLSHSRPTDDCDGASLDSDGARMQSRLPAQTKQQRDHVAAEQDRRDIRIRVCGEVYVE